MEKKSPIDSFVSPICKIHQSEENRLNYICFHADCDNRFKLTCFVCATDPEIHNHHQKGISYKPTRKTLEDLEKLANADIPLHIALLVEKKDYNMDTKISENEVQGTTEE